jgi:hypothetical protein
VPLDGIRRMRKKPGEVRNLSVALRGNGHMRSPLGVLEKATLQKDEKERRRLSGEFITLSSNANISSLPRGNAPFPS